MTNSLDLLESVKQILSIHRGRARAIKGKEIARLLGFSDDRQVRLAIRELIATGHPVASTTEAPAGYFLVETWQEARQYAESVKKRLIQDAIRRRDFRRSADLYLKPAEQGRLM